MPVETLQHDEVAELRRQLQLAQREIARVTVENELLSKRCRDMAEIEIFRDGTSTTVGELVHFAETAPTECVYDLGDILREMGILDHEHEATGHAQP